jgi:hypothetical protein
MIRGSSKTSALSEEPNAHRRAWLIALLLYGLVAGGDFIYHLTGYLHTGDRVIEYSEVAVAFSAALFWPVDFVAMALLAWR